MKTKNIYVIILLLCFLSTKHYGHNEFLKYSASAQTGGGILTFETTNPFHENLLHWQNYNINVYADFQNRAPNFDNGFWTEEEKNFLLFAAINNWDQNNFGNLEFIKSSTFSNSVPIVWSTDVIIFPEPGSGQSTQVLAFTTIAVEENNRIVYQRTGEIPAGHYEATGVICNNTANKGFNWTLYSSLTYRKFFTNSGSYEFGHVLGLAHCSETEALMEENSISNQTEICNN